jgi:hypothetical protein
VDFVADAEHCSVCGGILHAQKSKRRLVTTLEVGTFQAREIRKVCSVDRSHPVMASERLSRLVPRGQGYGYDLIVQVGLARYLRNLQREEIRAELLHENGIVVSEGTISNLCDRFLKLLERLHHYSVPALRAAMGGGYPLHIDATSEHGKGGLFLCLDGWRGWVLHAVKISSENEEELRPAIEKTVSLFGDPIAVVRDLSAAEAGAVNSLRDKDIPDLVCHYHFLGAIGKKLFDDHYAVLRNLLRSSKVRTGRVRTATGIAPKLYCGSLPWEIWAGSLTRGPTCPHPLGSGRRRREGSSLPLLPTTPWLLPTQPRGHATSRTLAAITPVAC